LPKKTADTIDEDGWLHTGDIGLYTAAGALKIIDRKKNIMKIANGEYIAPEKIENVYVAHPLVTEAFVDGQSDQEYVIGFIVPNKKAMMAFAEENGVEGTFEEVCKNEKLLDACYATFNKFCRDHKLYGFEICK
jgi:long-chain acyl-CoA synthetase